VNPITKISPKKPELIDNRNCFACGEKNPIGLRMSFRLNENDEIESEYVPDDRFQGFQGILHGGIMSVLLDEMMVNLAWKLGHNAVSAELRVRLKRPAKIGEKLFLKGRIDSIERRIVRTSAEARDADGMLLAEADAVCIKIQTP